MNRSSHLARRVFDALASLRLAVVVMVSLGTTCLLATIYESKHGTAAVQRHIYQTGWFAMILVTLGINIFCVLMSRYPWKKHHTGFVMAHIGILILLVGSLMSLHWGFDGNMAVLEGDTSDRIMLLTKVVHVGIDKGAPTRIEYDFEKSPPRPDRPRRFPLDDGRSTLVVEEFTPHVRVDETLEKADSGPAALHFVLEAPFATQDGWLVAGDSEREGIDFGPATFVFHTGDAESVKRLAPAAGQNHLAFSLAADGTLRYTLTAARADGRSGAIEVGKAIETPWMGMKVTVDQFLPHSRAGHRLVPDAPPVKDERRMPALKVHVEDGDTKSESEWVAWTEAVRLHLGERLVRVAYRAPELAAPFRVHLLKFRSEKYPGTERAATYESFVRVDDPEMGVSEHHISMNHPMHYRGYIFFQSSFVPGEPATSIFSVARAPGLPLVYLGTCLISLGVVWMFYVKPYLARRQAAQALAAHRERESRHAEKSEAAAPAAPVTPRSEPASGRA